ncbi:MAG: TIGR00725 family protein [Candidatus Omnitrophica bacterium]|nr:TIGR00725 family protein [Candidatus Omnitrophota bacterium]
MDKILISVIGGHTADKKTAKLAYDAGKMIAGLNAILICGGLGGVMEAAARGVKDGGGITVGILPGKNKEDANEYIDIPIPTGLGYTRNTLVAGASDLVIAFAGKEGTLSEIGFALSEKKPIIGLNTWNIPGIRAAISVEDARKKIVKILGLNI